MVLCFGEAYTKVGLAGAPRPIGRISKIIEILTL